MHQVMRLRSTQPIRTTSEVPSVEFIRADVIHLTETDLPQSGQQAIRFEETDPRLFARGNRRLAGLQISPLFSVDRRLRNGELENNLGSGRQRRDLPQGRERRLAAEVRRHAACV